MKIFTFYDNIKYSSELIILFGILDKLPNETKENYYKNKSRYGDIINFCKNNFIYVKNPDEADIFVLPYKFKGTEDMIYNNLLSLSNIHNKKVLCFFNDDSDMYFNLPDNVVLYRTSFYLTKKLYNEKSLAAFSPDFFNNKYIQEPKLSIGYCGHTMHNRNIYLNYLYKTNIVCNFILRRGFWAPGIDKDTARMQYFKNMEDNIFIFCYRGGGNFSYRFYETLMMGRIPIFIDTDCVIPYWNKIKDENIGIIVSEKELLEKKLDLKQIIMEYYEKHKNKLIDIQKNNRSLWETFFSPVGFIKNLINEY